MISWFCDIGKVMALSAKVQVLCEIQQFQQGTSEAFIEEIAIEIWNNVSPVADCN